MFLERAGADILDSAYQQSFDYISGYEPYLYELTQSTDSQTPTYVPIREPRVILLSNGTAFSIRQWAPYGGGVRHITNTIYNQDSGSRVTQSDWGPDCRAWG